MLPTLSVLQALVDNQLHGEVVRTEERFTLATRPQRCAACGYEITRRDVIVYAERPRVRQTGLWVHGACPTNHYHRLRWLTTRRGSDLLERWSEMTVPQNCGRCRRRSQPNEEFALVRLPGRPLTHRQHSVWVCRGCYVP